jgi:inosose dehydratase
MRIDRIECNRGLTRRHLLLATAATPLLAAQTNKWPLSVEGYIFQQYAQRQKKPLADVVEEVIPMARNAGFKNIELNQGFFTPELKENVLRSIRSNRLLMPSVYVGGAMHEDVLADRTISLALDIGALCRPFGCKAIVNNPDPKPQRAQKTDRELATQAKSLNRMGKALAGKGFQFRVHHHTPELVNNAREWRHILHNTDPKYVSLCLDLDWLYQGGMDPMAVLREAGDRVAEVHVRNSKDKLWLESFEDGDLDYRKITAEMQKLRLYPLVVIELAYRDNTVITRSLADDLRLSHVYARKIFA